MAGETIYGLTADAMARLRAAVQRSETLQRGVPARMALPGAPQGVCWGEVVTGWNAAQADPNLITLAPRWSDGSTPDWYSATDNMPVYIQWPTTAVPVGLETILAAGTLHPYIPFRSEINSESFGLLLSGYPSKPAAADLWHPWKIHLRTKAGGGYEYSVTGGRVYCSEGTEVVADEAWADVSVTTYVVLTIDYADPGGTPTAKLGEDTSAPTYWLHDHSLVSSVQEKVTIGRIVFAAGIPTLYQDVWQDIHREVGININSAYDTVYKIAGNPVYFKTRIGGVEKWCRLDLRIDHGRVEAFASTPSTAPPTRASSPSGSSATWSGS
jgi:hypothetical protein